MLSLFEIFKRYQRCLTADSTRFFICCGAIARQVLNNTLEAVKVLQQLYFCRADYILVASATGNLITVRMCKRMGWTIISYDRKLRLFIIKRVPRHKKISWLEKNINKDGLLDLSMSPNPIEELFFLIVEKNNILHKVTVIDLRWCHKPQFAVNFLTMYQSKFSGLKKILCCGYFAAFTKFSRKIKIEDYAFLCGVDPLSNRMRKRLNIPLIYKKP
jgi:hypothetical protein